MFNASNTNQVQSSSPSLPARSPRGAHAPHTRAAISVRTEGFELNPDRSLPDIWLPTVGIFIEVKGWFPTAGEKEKFRGVADDTQRRVAMICGDPGWETVV